MKPEVPLGFVPLKGILVMLKKNLPLVVVLGITLAALVGLHFMVFAPMKGEYDQVQSTLDERVTSLKNQITSVKWDKKQPDPRDPSFTWDKLLTGAKENYETKATDFKGLVSDIDLIWPAMKPDESIQSVLAGLRTLQELEEKNPTVLKFLEKWGLNTVATNGHNGSRPLDLRKGGYRSYSAENRIEGKQGTLQIAINVEPWFLADPNAAPDPKFMGKEIIFYAGKEKKKPAGTGGPTLYDSELIIDRTGINLSVTFRNQVNKTENILTTSVAGWLNRADAGSPWKVLKVTWGPELADMTFTIDGKSHLEVNQAAAAKALPGLGAGGIVPGGAGFASGLGRGMGMYTPYSEGSERSMGGGLYGGGGGLYGGGGGGFGQNPTVGITLEPLDGFIIGNDFQRTAQAKLMVDSVRIWNAPAKQGSDPPTAPIFNEDFESPFGSDQEMERAIDQLVRYHRDMYDPNYRQGVKDDNTRWYYMLFGFWGNSPGVEGIQTEWEETARTLAFLDHATRVVPKYGGMEDLARKIQVPIPGVGKRHNLTIFLELGRVLAQTLLDSGVDDVQKLVFLNWSNTVSDEPLKLAFQEAYSTLEAEMQVGMGPGMGMMGMMGGMGMMGMGMGMGGGYMDPSYAMMSGGGMPMDDDDAPPPPGGEAPDAKAVVDARTAAYDANRKKQEEMYEKFVKFQENQGKFERWRQYKERSEIPPDYYAEFKIKMAESGKDFFIRYSIQTEFICAKDRLAKTLHAIEFGPKLAFVSQAKFYPVGEGSTLVKSALNVEYNFMKSVDVSLPTDPGAVPPQADLGGAVPGAAIAAAQ